MRDSKSPSPQRAFAKPVLRISCFLTTTLAWGAGAPGERRAPPFFGGLVACWAARSQARDGSHRRWFRECHVALVPGGDSFGWPRIRTDHGKIKRTRYEHGLAGPAGAS